MSAPEAKADLTGPDCPCRLMTQPAISGRFPVVCVLLETAVMTSERPGFFQGTEMLTAGWWEQLWPDPAGVLAAVGIKAGMEVIDLCSGDGWFTLQAAKIARHVTDIDIDPSLLDVAR